MIYMLHDEQIQLAKSIREFLSNSPMAFLKGREMVNNAFESGIFLILPQLNPDQSEHSEQSERSGDHYISHHYISPE